MKPEIDVELPDPKTLARMQKLLELAKRGVGGEAANAQRFLTRLLAKHGMTLADISDGNQPRRQVEIKWKTTDERALLVQTIAKVTNDAGFPTWPVPGRKALFVDLTPAEHAEVLMHHAVLAPALAAHMRRSLAAFCLTNKLYATKRDEGTLSELPDPAELEALRALVSATRPTAVHKALAAPVHLEK